MKRIILVLVILCSVGLSAFAQNSEDRNIVVYYFHGNARCRSCMTIEQFTSETVSKFFNNELKSGKLSFKVINYDERNNKHFLKDYQLYTKSVVICLKENGQEVEYRNLNKVWEYLRNKEKFLSYIKNEVDSLLLESSGGKS